MTAPLATKIVICYLGSCRNFNLSALRTSPHVLLESRCDARIFVYFAMLVENNFGYRANRLAHEFHMD